MMPVPRDDAALATACDASAPCSRRGAMAPVADPYRSFPPVRRTLSVAAVARPDLCSTGDRGAQAIGVGVVGP